MVTYQIRAGETFGDFILNSCGLITSTNWSDALNANFESDWTPQLYNGQLLQIPVSTDTNVGNIADLIQYPANNYSVPDIYNQINAIFLLLESAVPVNIPVGSLPQIDTNTYYIVRPTETIGDAILNGSGDIENWDTITQAGFFDTWTPDLFAGQKIAIPSTANLNLNNFRALNTYPANNNSVPDVYDQILAIFVTLSGDPWILATSFWRDIGIWEDSASWID